MTKQQELDKLAEFALVGMKKNISPSSHISFLMPDGAWMGIESFNPYKDWNHLRLVLEALRKHEQQVENKTGAMAWALVLNDLSRQSCKNHYEKIDFNFASAICSTAKEVIAKSRKGE